MIYEHSGDLTVGLYQFIAYIFAPEESIHHRIEEDRLYSVRFAQNDDHRAMVLQYSEKRSIQFTAISIDDAGEHSQAVREILEKICTTPDQQPETIWAELNRLTDRTGLLAAAAIISIDESLQEDSANFAMVRVFMAGIPPLVMIEGGQYHFPARSGIPLGINDQHMTHQILEFPAGARVYLHSPLGGSGAGLKDLHSMLSDFRVEMIPPGVLLFGLDLKGTEM